MGVDYYANYGIGQQVKFIDDFNKENINIEGLDNNDFEGFRDFCYELFYLDITDDFRFFEVGEGAYSGENNEIYIVLKEPFKNGFDLAEVKESFEKFIKSYGFETIGDFGLVGGLEVS